MRKHSLLWVAFLTGIGVAAQKPLSYVSPTQNIEVQYSSGIVRMDPGPVYRFDVRYPGSKVHATIRDQGLEFFGDRVQAEAVDAGKNTNGIRFVTVTGGVRVIKSSGAVRSEI